MKQDSDVRRSFRVGGDTVANVSDTQLGLHDQSDLGHPAALGHLDLAPHYTALLPFGDYLVRVSLPDAHDSSDNTAVLMSAAEVIPSTGLADVVDPVARFDVPLYATLHKVGDLLVSATIRYTGSGTDETTLDVFDLSDPASPERVGQLVTTGLPVSDGYSTGSGWGPSVLVGSNALAFVRRIEGERSTSRVRQCTTLADDYRECLGKEGCSYWRGQRTSRILVHEDQVWIPEGRFGIHQLDLDASNLLQE